MTGDWKALREGIEDDADFLAGFWVRTHATAPALVWRFQDAPKELRALSTVGGGEDWLALFPPNYAGGAEVWWSKENTAFGNCSEEHVLKGGAVVRIGSHEVAA